MCFRWIGVFVALTIMVAESRKADTLDSRQGFVDQIEWYAAITGIDLNKLLIVDIYGIVRNHSFHTRASMLLGEREFLPAMEDFKMKRRNHHSTHMLRYGTVGPWYLSALAAPQLIAIVSDASPLREVETYDLYQNIRHKCVIHFFTSEL